MLHLHQGPTKRSDSTSDSDSDDDEEGAFETMKSITDNINVIITWITSLVLAGTYLFAGKEQGDGKDTWQ